jgi:hypothetical protein
MFMTSLADDAKIAHTSKPFVLPLGIFTIVAAALHSGSIAVFAYQHSFFREEDFDAMWLARFRPFPEFLLESIDEHFVPFHRMVAYVANALAPMSFAFAVGILFAFYLLAVTYMYLVLRQLERTISRDRDQPRSCYAGLLESPISWMLFGAWCTHLYLGPLFVWWTAGLHRLPLLAFALMAVYYYLRYRTSHRRREALLTIAPTIAAFGFFPKCVLIPLYLAAIELCLWTHTTSRDRRHNATLLAPLCALSLLYVTLWQILEPPIRTAIITDLEYHKSFIQLSWFMLRDSLIGTVWQQHPVLFASRLSLLGCGLLVAYTVIRAPYTTVIWIALAVVLTLNVLATSVSKSRAELFGLALPIFLHRYYFELATLVALFSALAVNEARYTFPAFLTRIRVPWLTMAFGRLSAPVAGAILAAIMLNSYSSSRHLIEYGYLSHKFTRDFVGRTYADANRIREKEGEPIRIVDDQLPVYAGMKGARSALYLLEAMGIPAEAATPGVRAYRIAPSGHIVPTML